MPRWIDEVVQEVATPRTYKPCRNFNNYKAEYKPKRKCCQPCWNRWNDTQNRKAAEQADAYTQFQRRPAWTRPSTNSAHQRTREEHQQANRQREAQAAQRSERARDEYETFIRSVQANRPTLGGGFTAGLSSRAYGDLTRAALRVGDGDEE